MERREYLEVLNDARFTLLGLLGEALTTDGKFVDDEANGALNEIVEALGVFAEKMEI